MHLELLKKMTIEKKYDDIYNYLNTLEQTLKGPIFSKYLGMLYIGNGINAKVVDKPHDKGCDVLLYKHQSTKAFMIVQAKNKKIALPEKEIKTEINQFETEAKEEYNCNHYILVSLNGFVRDGKDFKGLSNVRLENWDYVAKLISNYSEDGKPDVPHIELYEHNNDAFEEACELLEKHNRVAIVQATGTGKSYIAEKLITTLPEHKAIYISPNHYINNQFENMTLWFDNIDFVTYAGLSKYLENTLLEDDSFIILDEFHRGGADEWSKGVVKLLASNPKHKIIGLSATEIRENDNYRDMTEELFHGIKTRELNVFDAIARGILPEPIYVTAITTLKNDGVKIIDMLKKKGYSQAECEKVLSKIDELEINWRKSFDVPSMLSKYVTKEYRKAIVFCKNENHIDEIQGKVIEWFSDLKIFKHIKGQKIIHGDTKRNQKIIDEFEKADDKDTLNIIFSVDIFNEGLHVKDVSMLMFLRGTNSSRVFYQQLGRGLESGKQLRPLVFDMVDNFTSINKIEFPSEIINARNKISKRRADIGLKVLLEDFIVHDETKVIHEEFINTVQAAVIEIDNNRLNSKDKKKDAFVAGYRIYKDYNVVIDDSYLNSVEICPFKQDSISKYMRKSYVQRHVYLSDKSEEDLYRIVDVMFNSISILNTKVIKKMRENKSDFVTSLKEFIYNDYEKVSTFVSMLRYCLKKDLDIHMYIRRADISKDELLHIYLLALVEMLLIMNKSARKILFSNLGGEDILISSIRNNLGISIDVSVEDAYYNRFIASTNNPILSKEFVLNHFYLGIVELCDINDILSKIIDCLLDLTDIGYKSIISSEHCFLDLLVDSFGCKYRNFHAISDYSKYLDSKIYRRPNNPFFRIWRASWDLACRAFEFRYSDEVMDNEFCNLYNSVIELLRECVTEDINRKLYKL